MTTANRTVLTKKQKSILDFTTETIHRTGRAPTYREIAAHFGFAVNAAFCHVRAIEAKGALSRHDGEILLSKSGEKVK